MAGSAVIIDTNALRDFYEIGKKAIDECDMGIIEKGAWQNEWEGYVSKQIMVETHIRIELIKRELKEHNKISCEYPKAKMPKKLKKTME